MVKTNKLSASQEDYLEAIFHVVAVKRAAQPKDIARHLGVNHSSVTEAMRALAAKGLVDYEPYGVITLTPDGETIARDTVNRHEVLQDFFVRILAVPEDEASKAACKIEHVITRDIMERFVHFLQFVEACPRGGEGERMKKFKNFCEDASIQEAGK